MAVLVTGGAGFIGSHLVDALVKQGEEVLVVDDLSAGRPDRLAGHLNDGPVSLTIGSVLDRPLLELLVARVSVVYHLAAVVGVERVCADRAWALAVNINGTRAVLELCRHNDVKVVLASTSEVYGKNGAMPLREGDDTVLGRTVVSRWAYAVSKLADEHLAWAIMEGTPMVILRYFNSYGPRADPIGYSGVITRFIDQALRGLPLTVYGDGGQSRSFTYIDDTVAATLAAAEQASGEVFNVGRPEEISINKLAVMVRELTGSDSQIVHSPYPARWGPFEEQRRRVPDISRARERLDFRSGVALVDGLTRTIAWMRCATETGGQEVA